MEISDVLIGLYIATVLGIAVFSIIRRTAAYRTTLHYFAKTGLIVMVVLHILLLLLNVVDIVRKSDSAAEQAFYIAYAIIMGSLFTKAVIDVLKDDDDDWFNASWKKFKRWLKRTNRIRQVKPAIAD